MDDNSHKQSDQFDAALPLPSDDATPQPLQHHQKKEDKKEETPNPAVDLVRKKVAAVFAAEPNAQAEMSEVEVAADHADPKLSKHQRFIYDLTNSGKPLHEIQSAWHEYYAGLPDHEKHEVWQEFYKAHSATSHYHAATQTRPEGQVTIDHTQPLPLAKSSRAKLGHSISRNLANKYHSPVAAAAPRPKAASPLRSLIFGFSVGAVVLVIFLFSFFNERFIAPFIQPSRSANNTPIISATSSISPLPELIIPKINVQIPVIYATDNSDNTIENDLESGVVHYADTAIPGQNGNLVIFGHSSNNIFNPGKYKFAFVLLSHLGNGDTFYIDKDGKRYTYQIYDRQIVSPSDVSVLGLTDKPATATLITCDPPGTSTNRLVVSAEQIDPSPTSNTAATTDNKVVSQTKILPGNAPTLWSRIVKWLEE